MAAALLLLRNDTTATNLSLVMVVVVVAVAVPGRRLPAAIAGLGSGVWFDFFLTRPYYSFAVARHDDVVTTVLLLVVGLTVGELTARSRRHRVHATEAVDAIGLIHHVAETRRRRCQGGRRDQRGQPDARRACSSSAAAGSRRPSPSARARSSSAAAACRGERCGGRPNTMGLPDREVTLVVEGQGRPLGRFVLVPTAGLGVSLTG